MATWTDADTELGTGNDTFTVSTAGLYQINVQVVGDSINITPLIQVGATLNDGDDIYGQSLSAGTGSQIITRFRGGVTGTLYLNAGDTFRVRLQNGSTVLPSPLNTNGNCFIRVVKLD